VDFVKKQALEITDNRLERWTSFSTDTNNTQRRVWKLIQAIPELSHVHSIPCDSHGLQLVFKDLLWPTLDQHGQQIETDMGDFFRNGPNTVVGFFTSSDKQLAYLRGVQMSTFGKHGALISPTTIFSNPVIALNNAHFWPVKALYLTDSSF
jgi:hypothetical protein